MFNFIVFTTIFLINVCFFSIFSYAQKVYYDPAYLKYIGKYTKFKRKKCYSLNLSNHYSFHGGYTFYDGFNEYIRMYEGKFLTNRDTIIFNIEKCYVLVWGQGTKEFPCIESKSVYVLIEMELKYYSGLKFLELNKFKKMERSEYIRKFRKLQHSF